MQEGFNFPRATPHSLAHSLSVAPGTQIPGNRYINTATAALICFNPIKTACDLT